jgi:hypothetical protein
MLCLAIAAAFLLKEFWLRLDYEWHGPFNVDSPIYWAVGRGILNGLTPYRDLFETKPPGIFVLSAVSLWLRGDMWLASAAHTAALALLPVTVIAGSMRSRIRGHKTLEMMIMISALLFGVLLSLYSADKDIGFQVESLGSLFITVYAALIVKHRARWNMLRTLTASMLIFCGVGMKEPFILTAAACALLLAEHPRDLLRSFLIPALIAAVAGVLVLGVTGWLFPYLDIYLPEMLGRHIQQGEPMWMRGLMLNGIYDNVRSFLPALSLLTAGLAGTALLQLHGNRNAGRALFIVCSVAFAMYLLALAVGIGGSYWQHHYVFAVPGYAALFFVFIRIVRIHWHRFLPKTVLAAFATLSLYAGLTITPQDYTEMAGWILYDQDTMQTSAGYIDSVLDACDIDRYLYLGSNGYQPFGYTEHSPIGPLFLQFDEWLHDDRPAFREAILRQTDSAFFIVRESMNLNWLNVPVKRYIEQNFSQEPWPCARNIPRDTQYEYLFRLSEPDVPLVESAAALIGDAE